MMDDLISRQAAIDEITEYGSGNTIYMSVAELKRRIEHLPSAQPEPIKIQIDHELTKDEYEKLRKDLADAPIVLLPSAQSEIVRCKDCKHYAGDGMYCAWDIMVHYEHFYCYHAERRTDEDKSH